MAWRLTTLFTSTGSPWLSLSLVEMVGCRLSSAIWIWRGQIQLGGHPPKQDSGDPKLITIRASIGEDYPGPNDSTRRLFSAMGSSGVMLNEIDLEYELSWQGVGLVDVGGTELLMTIVIGGERPQTSLSSRFCPFVAPGVVSYAEFHMTGKRLSSPHATLELEESGLILVWRSQDTGDF